MVSKNQLASPRSAFRNFYHPHFSLQKILRPPPPNSSAPPPFFVIVLVCCCFILGDPGPVGRVGRKGGTKVFKYGRKSPWVPTLTELFPKIQADAGSWLGTKNALYYCAQSANSFSWVLFVSSYTLRYSQDFPWKWQVHSFVSNNEISPQSIMHIKRCKQQKRTLKNCFEKPQL